MERLTLKITIFCKALKTLEDSFTVLEKARKNHDTTFIMSAQDSVIKRFEYSYDFFWKIIKLYLEEKYNLSDINSPRSVFRASVKQGLCTEAEGEQLLLMINSRNITTHTYDINEVERILPYIPEHYTLMKTITKRIEKINLNALHQS